MYKFSSIDKFPEVLKSLTKFFTCEKQARMTFQFQNIQLCWLVPKRKKLCDHQYQCLLPCWPTLWNKYEGNYSKGVGGSQTQLRCTRDCTAILCAQWLNLLILTTLLCYIKVSLTDLCPTAVQILMLVPILTMWATCLQVHVIFQLQSLFVGLAWFSGHAISQALRCWLPTQEALVKLQWNHHGICGRKVALL
jgi:hypothetical protein